MVSAISTLGLLIASILQFCTMRAQLDEMHAAGKQTDQAIAAAIRLAETAKHQADISEMNLVTSQRPWVDLVGDVEVREPLTFTDESVATLTVKASAKNTGHSPALNVLFKNTLYVSRARVFDPMKIIEANECHDQIRSTRTHPFSQLILPNDTISLTPTKNSSKNLSSSDVIGGPVMVLFVLCVSYADSFGFPYSTTQLFVYNFDNNARISLPFVGGVNGHLVPFTGRFAK